MCMMYMYVSGSLRTLLVLQARTRKSRSRNWTSALEKCKKNNPFSSTWIAF